MIGLGTAIANSLEFNRRALIALKGVSFGYGSRAPDIVDSCQRIIDGNRDLSPRQQQALYNIVHRFRGQIHDKLVTEYAATRAKGAD